MSPEGGSGVGIKKHGTSGSDTRHQSLRVRKYQVLPRAPAVGSGLPGGLPGQTENSAGRKGAQKIRAPHPPPLPLPGGPMLGPMPGGPSSEGSRKPGAEERGRQKARSRGACSRGAWEPEVGGAGDIFVGPPLGTPLSLPGRPLPGSSTLGRDLQSVDGDLSNKGRSRHLGELRSGGNSGSKIRRQKNTYPPDPRSQISDLRSQISNPRSQLPDLRSYPSTPTPRSQEQGATTYPYSQISGRSFPLYVVAEPIGLASLGLHSLRSWWFATTPRR
jgi:hypothetical protein